LQAFLRRVSTERANFYYKNSCGANSPETFEERFNKTAKILSETLKTKIRAVNALTFPVKRG